MGLTSQKVRVSNPAARRRGVELDLFLDTGALYSVVPARVLVSLGIRPHGTEIFELADGKRIRRQVGTAFFEIGPRQAASTVIFGRPSDSCLLGALALEGMALVLDLAERRLRPMRAIRL